MKIFWILFLVAMLLMLLVMMLVGAAFITVWVIRKFGGPEFKGHIND